MLLISFLVSPSAAEAARKANIQNQDPNTRSEILLKLRKEASRVPLSNSSSDCGGNASKTAAELQASAF